MARPKLTLNHFIPPDQRKDKLNMAVCFNLQTVDHCGDEITGHWHWHLWRWRQLNIILIITKGKTSLTHKSIWPLTVTQITWCDWAALTEKAQHAVTHPRITSSWMFKLLNVFSFWRKKEYGGFFSFFVHWFSLLKDKTASPFPSPPNLNVSRFFYLIVIETFKSPNHCSY